MGELVNWLFQDENKKTHLMCKGFRDGTILNLQGKSGCRLSKFHTPWDSEDALKREIQSPCFFLLWGGRKKQKKRTDLCSSANGVRTSEAEI